MPKLTAAIGTLIAVDAMAPASKALLVAFSVLAVAILGGVGPCGSERVLDSSVLDDLIPSSALPEGFTEVDRGLAVLDSPTGSPPPSLRVSFEDREGNRLAFSIIADQSADAARRHIRDFSAALEQLPYGEPTTPVLPGELIVGGCDSTARPASEHACMFVDASVLRVGTDERSFASAFAIEGRDITLDIFRRETVVAGLWIYTVAGSDHSELRERLANAMDERIRASLDQVRTSPSARRIAILENSSWE